MICEIVDLALARKRAPRAAAGVDTLLAEYRAKQKA
jgi:hypothetical protein